MNIKDLFPADLESCRSWNIEIAVHNNRANFNQDVSFIISAAQEHRHFGYIKFVSNGLNPIWVQLNPYILGWQLANQDKKCPANWSDDLALLRHLLHVFDNKYESVVLKVNDVAYNVN